MATVTATKNAAKPVNVNGRAPAVPKLPIWRLSVAQYHQMIQSGILDEDDPVELLEGWLVVKMAKKPPHSSTNWRTFRVIDKRLPKGWLIKNQEPITLAQSEPEPDNCVVRGGPDDFESHHPFAGDVGLVIETADSSLERDRTWKKRIYAKARIPVYWIINLIDRQVEVYSEPSGTAARADYNKCKVFTEDESVPLVLDGKKVARIPVRELLPKTRS